MTTQSYANNPTYVAYVYMTNHPEYVDHYVSVHNKFGSEAKSTNYETRYNGQVCYNLTNYEMKDMGRIGNHRWIELIFGKDCVTGRIINEHVMTEEEPFSFSNVYWYNKYSESENPPTCIPAMYNYHVILTRSKDPDVKVKQMIKNYVEEHNIKGLYRQDPFECDI
ncbi:uncharacterized protein LOC128164219 [Crassostrea angulata]|uniref:uncharacterized protein LOC128164219 n=1 Tax=Magallana angulata TaxID=2784310 RepID=UPI0022B197C5|nr:uncharacterized protein LOC128164219 [Crassostrea angulata]